MSFPSALYDYTSGMGRADSPNDLSGSPIYLGDSSEDDDEPPHVNTLNVTWRLGRWDLGDFPPRHERIAKQLYNMVRQWARSEFLRNKDAWEYRSKTKRFVYAPHGQHTLPVFSVDEDGELLSTRINIKVEYDDAGNPIGLIDFKL